MNLLLIDDQIKNQAFINNYLTCQYQMINFKDNQDFDFIDGNYTNIGLIINKNLNQLDDDNLKVIDKLCSIVSKFNIVLDIFDKYYIMRFKYTSQTEYFAELSSKYNITVNVNKGGKKYYSNNNYLEKSLEKFVENFNTNWTFTNNTLLFPKIIKSQMNLLPNNKILLTGGFCIDCFQESYITELYNIETRLWEHSGTIVPYLTRIFHTATTLKNNFVLITGGLSFNFNFQTFDTTLQNCMYYDYIQEQWNQTSDLNIGRMYHSAVLLNNGNVLVTGGSINNQNNSIKSCELYNINDQTWQLVADMKYPRQNHTSHLLPNGKVIVIGGITNTNDDYQTVDVLELYDPETNTWEDVPTTSNSFYFHTSTELNDGRILILGSETNSICEIYDPELNSIISGSSPNYVRYGHTATLLNDGTVMIVGGYIDGNITNTCELYNPNNDTWTIISCLNLARGLHSAILANDNVLVSGGITENVANGSTTSELYLGYLKMNNTLKIISTIKSKPNYLNKFCVNYSINNKYNMNEEKIGKLNNIICRTLENYKSI
jgi:N-acetylneuraminic acid mutarotase